MVQDEASVTSASSTVCDYLGQRGLSGLGAVVGELCDAVKGDGLRETTPEQMKERLNHINIYQISKLRGRKRKAR